MRGFLLGLLLCTVVALSVLSLRPGGLRHQLRNVGWRLRVALVLAGTYLVGSGVARLIWKDGPGSEVAEVCLGAVLALVFVVLGRDRPLTPLE